MPLAGRKLSIGWALALNHHVGFRGHELTVATALMTAESGRYTQAWHDNVDEATGNVTSIDRGLFQINDRWHPDLSDAEAYQPIPNARYAFKMSSGKYFVPWMAYNSGAYKRYMLEVWTIRDLGLWKKKIHRVETELGQP